MTSRLRGGTRAGSPSPSGSRETPLLTVDASAPETYRRIRAAICPFHGLAHDDQLEEHARRVTLRVLEARGAA